MKMLIYALFLDIIFAPFRSVAEMPDVGRGVPCTGTKVPA